MIMPKDRTEKLKRYIKEDRPSKFKSYVTKHNINVRDVELRKGQTLLHYSCNHGNEIIFRYLMRKSVDVSIQDNKGDTALHVALRYAIKSNSDTVYTNIILPLLEKYPGLLEVVNNHGLTCRNLLDRLVQVQQDQDKDYKLHDSDSDEDENQSWEDKLAEEFRNETSDFTGRYSENDHSYDNAETYDDWADRLSREYHMKRKYTGFHHGKPTTSSKSQKADDGKENLEEIRRKMRQKYDENMKKDKENRVLVKSRKYNDDMNILLRGEDEIKFKDVPWPFMDNVSEVKTVMFTCVVNDKEAYKKLLREEQIRWHPDKFLQKLGKRLYDADKDRIMERVKEISQELNRLSDLVIS